MVTTATDVARADIALLKAQVLPSVQAQEEVTRVALAGGKPAPTALGLFVDQENGLRRYYHSGQGLGFTALNMIYPDQQLAIVVLVNTSVGESTLRIADSIGYLLLPVSANDAFARKVFAALQAGTLSRELLTGDMQKEWSARRAKTYRESLGGLGAVTSFVGRQPETLDALETHDYDVIAGGRALKLHLLLTSEGKLEDVTVTGN